MRKERPSNTAQIVARGVWLTACQPDLAKLVPAEMSEWTARYLAACPSGGEWRVRLMKKAWYRRLQYALEGTMIPGIALHYVLRKRYIEEAVRERLAEGIRQVVILGAGFDTLASRLHREFPDVRFFEIDHPATQEVKHHALDISGLHAPNLRLLPLDLTNSTVESLLLESREYNPAEPLVLVMEGLTMYLSEKEVQSVFAFVRKQSGQESEIIFTFMEQDKDGNAYFPAATALVRLWLLLKGEPFKWGCARSILPEFLERNKFSAIEIADTDYLRNCYLTGKTRTKRSAPGEMVCRAAKQ